jgi:hypothetical protein
MLLSHADGSQELGELGASVAICEEVPAAVQHNACVRTSETALSVNFLATRILTITTCV